MRNAWLRFDHLSRWSYRTNAFSTMIDCIHSWSALFLSMPSSLPYPLLLLVCHVYTTSLSLKKRKKNGQICLCNCVYKMFSIQPVAIIFPLYLWQDRWTCQWKMISCSLSQLYPLGFTAINLVWHNLYRWWAFLRKSKHILNIIINYEKIPRKYFNIKSIGE